MYIESEDTLRELYGFPKGRAKAKQLDKLEKHSINFIQHAPFLTLSTYNKVGLLDCSPRGGKAGFVKVIDQGCILIPDSKGNNRLDSLVNIVETGQVGCLFFIPGVDETLRINGTARISTDKQHLSLFEEESREGRHPPKSSIEIRISEVFLHCAKSLMRSELWSSDAKIARSDFPTMGVMVNDQIGSQDEPESQAAMIERYKQNL